MLVTRQRKKRFPWKRLVAPLVLLALVALAFTFSPSRAWIAAQTSPVWKPLASPLDAVAQRKALADSSRRIAALRMQLDEAQKQLAARDKRIAALQAQVQDAAQPAAAANKATPRPLAGAQPTPGADDLAQQATPDMRRTAAEWSAMDADSAAKVVQKLPVEYVARVFAVMTPDSAGAILESLPVSYAAALTQERPELKR